MRLDLHPVVTLLVLAALVATTFGGLAGMVMAQIHACPPVEISHAGFTTFIPPEP